MLLLDEIEKAHPDIFNILLQVMDRGVLTDTNGREANFKNVVLVMTTNAGAAQASRRSIGFTKQDHATDAMETIRRSFTPEFRNRLDAVVQFRALGFEHILRVVDKFLIELEMLLQDKHVSLSATPTARDWLAHHGFDPLMGARPMARVIRTRSSVRWPTSCCSASWSTVARSASMSATTSWWSRPRPSRSGCCRLRWSELKAWRERLGMTRAASAALVLSAVTGYGGALRA